MLVRVITLPAFGCRLNKNEDSLLHVLGRVPQENVKRDVDDYINQQCTLLRRETAAKQKLSTCLTELETNRKVCIVKYQPAFRGIEESEDSVLASLQNGVYSVKEYLAHPC